MKCYRKKIGLSFIFMLWCHSAIVSQSHNTKTKVTLQHGQIPLIKLIDILKKQSGYSFAYDCKLIDPKKNVVCNFPPNADIEQILTKSLPKTISFKRKGNHIILYSTKPTHKAVITAVKTDAITKNESSLPSTDSTSTISNDTLVYYPTYNTMEKTEKWVDTNSITTSNEINKNEKPKEISTQTDSTKSKIQHSKINTATTITPTDSSKARENHFVFETEIATYNRLECVSLHLGYKRYFASISYSSNFNTAQWVGVGIGTDIPLFSKFSLSAEICYNTLFGGDSFNKGLTASTIQFKPTINYQLFKFLKLVAGPEAYLLTKKLTDPSTKAIIEASPSLGYGIYCGVRIDLKQLIFKN